MTVTKIVLTGLVAFFFPMIIFAQGQYAGTMKKLVGVSYADERNIEGLTNWQFRRGSLISSIHDIETITTSVFQKGTSYIVLFSIKEDSTQADYKIMDVLEIKNVPQAWQPYTGLCRQNEQENMEIIALVKWSSSQEILKPAWKAWRFNRDKRRVELLSIKGVDCLNEGVD